MSLRNLLRELGRNRTISEFIASDEQVVRAHRDSQGSGNLISRQLRALVFVDSRAGRGQAEVVIGNPEDRRAIRPQVESAVARAKAHQGPAWRLTPAAAPARVAVRDFKIDGREDQAVASLFERTESLARSRQVESWVQTRALRCVTSTGFDNRYRATTVGIRARVGRAGDDEQVTRSARRLADLGIKAALDAARRRLSRPAKRTPPGRYRLVVQAQAMGPSPGQSIFAPLVELCDAERFRLGIGRRRLGQIATGEEVTIRSNGTRNYGLYSRPFDDHGAATRQWSLIEDGRLADLALSARAAALLEREANGGVGNLEVRAPRRAMADVIAATDDPVLVVDRASWLDSDPISGALSLGLARGRLIAPSGRVDEVRGGVLGAGADLFAAPVGSLQDAQTPWYRGPAALRLGTVHLT